MNPLRLDQLSWFDAGPGGLIDLAVELEIGLVDMWTAGSGAVYGACLVTAENSSSIRARLDDGGVRANTVEIFRLAHSPDGQEWSRGLEIGARLGATFAAVINADIVGTEEVADALGRFTAVAGEFGLTPALEPTWRSPTRTLAAAQDVIRRSGGEARIVVDVLHVVRAGQAPADIRSIDPGLIAAAQICDGHRDLGPEERLTEGPYNRLAPGEGDFPLLEFLAALPPDCVLGIEVPMRRLLEAGWSPRQRARRVVFATRRLQEMAAARNP